MMMKRDQLLFWKYVAPSVFAAVIGGSFAIVDAIFIGLAGGKNGLAATALTWPLVMLLQAFGFLVGSGGAVLIAQSRGANRPDQEKRFFDQTLFLVFAWSILLTVCTLPLLGTLLKFLGATAELMPVSLRYSQILICGVFFSIFMSMCLEVIRNDGHPTLSMLLMVTGLLCNIALDWLFVFPLGFGAVGAAIATVISQAGACLLGTVYFFSSLTKLRFSAGIFRPAWREIGKITVTRGPVVYCLEQPDNGKQLQRVFLRADAHFETQWEPQLLGGVCTIRCMGDRLCFDDWAPDELYGTGAPQYRLQPLTLIPYYAWANRGLGEMTVWIHERLG